MKEKVIETAGKTWQYLGQNGETSVAELAQAVKEKEEIVYQSLGWLAREDKINYSSKNKQNFVSLVDSELNAFRSIIQNAQAQAQQSQSSEAAQPQAKQRQKSRSASRI
jgi:hypothetical protein